MNFHSDNAEYSKSMVFVKSLYSHIFSKAFLYFSSSSFISLFLSPPLSPLFLYFFNFSNTVGKSHLSSILALVWETGDLSLWLDDNTNFWLYMIFSSVQFSSIQSLSHVRHFVTPWITAHQASLSITNARSSLRLTSIESMVPSSHLILGHPFSCPQSIPASESLPMSQLFASGVQSTGVSALASFLLKKPLALSPSEWTGWISLQSKGLSGVFSNTTVQKHQFFGAQASQSNSHIHTWLLEKP